MVGERKGMGALVLRLLVGLALLGCARVGSAAGTWSVISLPSPPQRSGQVTGPSALAVDSADNLYVADPFHNRIQKRDTQGNWSVIATQAAWYLAADKAGNLSTAYYNHGIQKQDALGNWSVIAVGGRALGQVNDPRALAVDTAGNLYVADGGYDYPGRIQRRDAQGNWSLIATGYVAALAVDTAGNRYVGEWGRIRKRDAQGHWSVIATQGTAVGQVSSAPALSEDGGGNLYVADTGNYRVQRYTPQP